MRVIVFGATGKTGRHSSQNALEQGHQVTAFGRSVENLDSGEGLSTFKGDVFHADAVAEALAGHDAAIVCLGSTNLKDKTTLSAGTKNIVDAMVRHDVKRLVIISAAGVDESWKQIPWTSRILFKTMLRNVFAEHEAQEAIVRQSPLDWRSSGRRCSATNRRLAPTHRPTPARSSESVERTWRTSSSAS